MSRLQSASLGAGCCAVAAAGLTPVITQTPFTSFAPLVFLVVIVFVAARFGNFAGMFGTLTAALVFAIFLFEPRFSLTIEDAAARNHLIWMVVIGLVISDLLGAYAVREKNEKRQS
jgi:K+-sensing histidine kinase KdpD